MSNTKTEPASSLLERSQTLLGEPINIIFQILIAGSIVPDVITIYVDICLLWGC